MPSLTSYRRCAAALLLATLCAASAHAGLYINELYWDPPSNPDSPREYIELRGTPGMSLANHYLLFIENEDNLAHDGSAGTLETFFDLNGMTIGSNGLLTLRQKNSPFTPDAGASNYINTGFGNGWGASSAASSIGAWDQGGEGEIENSGFTAMLIRNDGTPLTLPQQHAVLLGQDLDVGNDGLDFLVTNDGPYWKIVNPDIGRNWTILDSIGVFGEEGEAGLGRTYGKINFGQELPGESIPVSKGGPIFQPSIEPGATYVGVGYEIELAARWGNSTGHTAADWHVTNISDKSGTGSQSWIDLRQSCIGDDSCHAVEDGDVSTPPSPRPTESNYAVPYGTQLIDNLGRPNFMLGDYNKDGYVDAADYTVWRDTLGETASDLADHPADVNHDYVVNAADYQLWKAHYGGGGPGAGTGPYGAVYIAPLASGSGSLAHGVPEPTTHATAAICALMLSFFCRRSKA